MATGTRRTTAADRATLRGVDWATYRKLRREPRNGHLRMSYLDGTLTLMSPEYVHDKDSRRFALLVDSITEALGIPIQGTHTSTLRRKGPGPIRGAAKEPDSGFYFGENEPRMRTRTTLDLDVDPPPDLAIEIDHSRSSARALRIYARLGVPEVWRFRTRSGALWFGRLAGDAYQPIERSLNLPRLTPALALHALGQVDQMGETAWKPWAREWARGLPEPPAQP